MFSREVCQKERFKNFHVLIHKISTNINKKSILQFALCRKSTKKSMGNQFNQINLISMQDFSLW